MKLRINLGRPAAGRRGFALILALTLLALMLTFLVAAQGALMTQVNERKRQSDRDLVQSLCDEAVARATGMARAGAIAPEGASINLERDGFKATLKLTPAEAADPIYSTQSRLARRPGDAMATLEIAPSTPPAHLGAMAEPARVRRYLINPARSTPAIEIISARKGL